MADCNMFKLQQKKGSPVIRGRTQVMPVIRGCTQVIPCSKGTPVIRGRTQVIHGRTQVIPWSDEEHLTYQHKLCQSECKTF